MGQKNWKSQQTEFSFSYQKLEYAGRHLEFSYIELGRLLSSVQFSHSVMSDFFATPWTVPHQASLPITNSWNLLKLMSVESVMPWKHFILSSSSPLVFNLSQHQGLYKWVSSSHQVVKVLEFQLQLESFQWIFETDFL